MRGLQMIKLTHGNCEDETVKRNTRLRQYN